MLEFVLSELDFVQDENNFMNSLLHVRSGSGSGGQEINGIRSGSGGPKSTDQTGSGSSSLYF